MKLIKDLNFKKILSLISQQNGSPYFNAKGIAAGVFSGCFPFFGFQTLLGIFLAQIIKGNILLAAIGTWISNPFTYIPLYFFNYKVGDFLLKNSNHINMQDVLVTKDFWKQGWFFTSRLILGSSIVGLILGLLCGLVTYKSLNKKIYK